MKQRIRYRYCEPNTTVEAQGYHLKGKAGANNKLDIKDGAEGGVPSLGVDAPTFSSIKTRTGVLNQILAHTEQ